MSAEIELLLAEKLHPRLRLLACRPPAAASATAALKRRFPQLPADYFDLAMRATELELITDTGLDFRIYDPEGVDEMTHAYQLPKYFPGAIAVGDSSGQALIYAEGARGFGLYRVGWGSPDREEAGWVAPSLNALLFDGEGLDR